MKKFLLSIIGFGILLFGGNQIFANSIIYTHSLGNGFTFSQDADFSYIQYGTKILYKEDNQLMNVVYHENENLLTLDIGVTSEEKTFLNDFFHLINIEKMHWYNAGQKMQQSHPKIYGTLIHRAVWKDHIKVASLGKGWYSILYPPYEVASYAFYNTRYSKFYDFATILNNIIQVKVGVSGVYAFYGDGERGEQGIALLTNDGKIIEQPLLMSNNEVLRSFDLLSGRRLQLNLLTNTSYSPEGKLLGKSEKRIIKVQF